MADTTLRLKQLRLTPLDLVATTVHELKSPLVVIGGLSELLVAGELGRLNIKQRQALIRINQVSERLLHTVNSLITLNRAKHGSLMLTQNPINLVSVIEDVISELAPALKKSKVKIIKPKRPSLPQVLGDRLLLHQLFYNLIDNTAKYAPANSKLRLRYKKKTKQLEIQLIDRGFAVSSGELKYLFERFGSQVQPVRAHGGSSGLGLFIVKNLAELQGGNVRAKPLGKGTCLTVSLPVARQLELFG